MHGTGGRALGHWRAVRCGGQVGSEYGESEQRIRDVFAEGRRHGRAVIFVDEVDVVATARSQVCVGDVPGRAGGAGGDAWRHCIWELRVLPDVGLVDARNTA